MSDAERRPDQLSRVVVASFIGTTIERLRDVRRRLRGPALDAAAEAAPRSRRTGA